MVTKRFKKLITRLTRTYDIDEPAEVDRIIEICAEYEKRAQAALREYGSDVSKIYPVLDNWLHSEVLPDQRISKYSHTFDNHSTTLELTCREVPTVGHTFIIRYLG